MTDYSIHSNTLQQNLELYMAVVIIIYEYLIEQAETKKLQGTKRRGFGNKVVTPLCWRGALNKFQCQYSIPWMHWFLWSYDAKWVLIIWWNRIHKQATRRELFFCLESLLADLRQIKNRSSFKKSLKQEVMSLTETFHRCSFWSLFVCFCLLSGAVGVWLVSTVGCCCL